jgi:VanZ family protein
MAGAGRTALLTAVIAIILIATLLPAPVHPGAHQPQLSARGFADALANILLFAPFGVAAALRFGSFVPALASGALLSIVIELIQAVVPGRFPSPSDVVFNALGTACGVWLVRRFDDWARPRSLLRWALPFLAVAVSMTVLAGGPFLFGHAIPPNTLFGQWTAQFDDMTHYEGRVLAAFVGMMPVPAQRIATSNTLRHRLLGGETVRVEFIAGPPPTGLAPIFSIYDDRADEVLLIGADAADVVVRFRTRARAARLDEREFRVAGALAGVKPGTQFTLRYFREGRGYCLAVGRKSWCDLGFTMGDSWGLLLYPIPRGLALIMPFLWLAVLAFPAGFWIRNDIALAALGLLFAIVLDLVPRWAGILPTPVPQFAAVLAGAALGSIAGRQAERWSRARPAAPDTVGV